MDVVHEAVESGSLMSCRFGAEHSRGSKCAVALLGERENQARAGAAADARRAGTRDRSQLVSRKGLRKGLPLLIKRPDCLAALQNGDKVSPPRVHSEILLR